MSRPNIINLICFNVLWLACTWGGNIIALASLLVFLQVHILYVSSRTKEWCLNLPFVIVGLLAETAIQSLGFISFTGSHTVSIHTLEVALPPTWLICLWVGLSSTLHHSLMPLLNRPILIPLACCIAIPWSYYAGAKLSSSSIISPIALGLSIETIVWIILLLTTAGLLRHKSNQTMVSEPRN